MHRMGYLYISKIMPSCRMKNIKSYFMSVTRISSTTEYQM